MVSLLRRKTEDFIIIGIMLLIMAAVIVFNKSNPIEYTMYNSESIKYYQGVVAAIHNEELVPVEQESNRFLGMQSISVLMKNGSYKGQELIINNYLSTTHNIRTKVGQRVIIKADCPENAEPFFSVYNYDRKWGIVIMLVFVAFLMAAVGREKGIKSFLSLGFTLFIILELLLPMIFHGYSPVLSCIITILITTAISMLLLNGYSKKTLTAILATFIGIVLSAFAFGLFTKILHINGYNIEEAEELILISENTGLKISQILFAGVLIASLGAVMDMTMSIASALYEMKMLKPNMPAGDIFLSGINIGKDMIGTMSATLILAFTGTALTTMLVMISYGVQLEQILNSDYIAIEIAHSITGSIAVILTVPITAGLAAYFTGKK